MAAVSGRASSARAYLPQSPRAPPWFLEGVVCPRPEIGMHLVVVEALLKPYEPYLLMRWEKGCHTAPQLWREIRAQGFAHSVSTIHRSAATGRP